MPNLSFEGKDALLSTAQIWIVVVTIACISGMENSLYAQDCNLIHDVISYDAAEGLLPDEVSQLWIAGCGNSQWIDGKLAGSVLNILDDSNQQTHPPNGIHASYCQFDVFECSSQNAVFEIVGQAEPGANSTPPHNIDISWMSGFTDFEKSITIAITENAVGFTTVFSPVDWLSNEDGQAKFNMDTTDTLHTYRVEKHARTQAKLFVDDQLRVTWDYANLDAANGQNRVTMATTSSPGVTEFSIQSFRYL